jgi:mono/diheme cytochrome c family protein
MFCRNLKAILVMAFINICSLISLQALAAPDAASGKAKSQTCFACHGVDGIGSSPNIPHIAAQPPLSIFYQLVMFREGMRKGGGMPPAMAQSMGMPAGMGAGIGGHQHGAQKGQQPAKKKSKSGNPAKRAAQERG